MGEVLWKFGQMIPTESRFQRSRIGRLRKATRGRDHGQASTSHRRGIPHRFHRRTRHGLRPHRALKQALRRRLHDDSRQRLHGHRRAPAWRRFSWSTYVAGPYPDGRAKRRGWTSGSPRAASGSPCTAQAAAAPCASKAGNRRKMVRLAHHDLLGAYFLNHPPVRRFDVAVEAPDHPLLAGLPASFETADELYLVEPVGESTVLLTTDLPEDPSPEGFRLRLRRGHVRRRRRQDPRARPSNAAWAKVRWCTSPSATATRPPPTASRSWTRASPPTAPRRASSGVRGRRRRSGGFLRTRCSGGAAA